MSVCIRQGSVVFGSCRDIHQLLARKNEFLPEQQAWTFSVKQEVPDPQHIHIKEKNDLRSFQREEQLQAPEEADIAKCSSTLVKRECGPPQSQFHHSEKEKKRKVEPVTSILKTETDGNHRSGLELDSHSGPLPQVDEDADSDSSESDVDDKPLKSKRDTNGDPYNTQYKIFCRVCFQRFRLWKHLRKHMGTHVKTHKTQKGEKTFACSFCGKNSSNRKALSLHVRIHAVEKEFSCSDCGRGFTRNQQLTNHMKVHTGEKPFPCSVCGKRFSSKGNFAIHMRTHTGEKPFSCSVCSKRFSSQTGVQIHRQTHTREKHFFCSVCAEGFTRIGNLQRHMRTHTGERPFVCAVCDSKFVQKEHLVAHVSRIHAGGKSLSCGVCYKRFSHQQEADKHECTGENSSSK
ncbi:peroxisomal membrane protein 11C isoform X2 [Phyllopteryx taeniolatus]|uniref:peroxisomal membrane protein 11C isoform X2 n=1 Tax=Phyllopteryx taeniolatus TaxID=161469 RepID=UPI002AD42682|nr:peroxisomal membrane protein 11C isoform X2 [Phyllopteryx taeniolatus]